MINPKQFQRVFADWMNECHQVSSGEVIAIDGKTLPVFVNRDVASIELRSLN